MKRYIAILLILASCNPANRVLRNHNQFERVGQKWLETHPCVNDSVTIYLPGKRDSILIMLPENVSNPEHFDVRDLLDSIRIAADHIDATCQPRIAEAYKKGYQSAIKKVSAIRVPGPIHDTVRVIVKDRQFNQVLEANLNRARQILQECEQETKKVQGSRNTWFYAFLLTLLLLIFVSYINLNKKWH